MSDTQARMRILEMLEEGRLDADEALGLLGALRGKTDIPTNTAGEEPVVEVEDHPEKSDEEEEAATESIEPDAVITPQWDLRRWSGWWHIPLWTGVGILLLGAMLMYLTLTSRGVGLWFFFSLLPFFFGLALVVIAWQIRSAPWLHVRIEQTRKEPPQTMLFGFPLPTGAAGWMLRIFGNRMGGQADAPMIRNLISNVSPENPLFLHVEDEEDGERVEIYIA